MTAHAWFKLAKKCNVTYCWKCGLVRLNNELSRWCARHGCEYEDHPDYERKVKELGRNE